MPAKSKSQQRLFGMVDAYQKGELDNASEEVKDIAKEISHKDARKFAKTKHKGLLNKVKPKKKTNESIRISSEGLHAIIAESIIKVLKESEDFEPTGYKTDSNWGGKEVQISKNGDAARFRDNHGTPGQPTEWLEIQFDEDGVAYVETENGTERLDEYMRINY